MQRENMTAPDFEEAVKEGDAMTKKRAGILICIVCCLGFLFWSPAYGADWSQFMRVSEHTGDAADEKLTMPLGLVAQVKLDDAILTSPAVVDGRAYVVDQMGTAYCIDPEKGEILWKTAPDGDSAMGRSVLSLSKGSNTSSPAIADGRMYYGTTAGNFRILDTADGSVIRTVRLGWPVVASPVLANDSLYFQTIDGVLHCLDLKGNERWKWDYFDGNVPAPTKDKQRWYRYDTAARHYSVSEVAVCGRQVVSSNGADLYCLEDIGKGARFVWTTRSSIKERFIGLTDYYVPTAAVISGDYVYSAWPGSDRTGVIMRLKLADGTLGDKKLEVLGSQWMIMGTPAVRGGVSYFGRQVHGITAWELGKTWKQGARHWAYSGSGRMGYGAPIISSPALSAGHCLFTTLKGELVAVQIDAKGSRGKLTPAPFVFKTPYGKPISSSPAVSNGKVFFGCDDGHLYVLAQGGKLIPGEEKLTVHHRKDTLVPATGKRYSWPSPYGGPGNTNFADDPELKPPFRLRWAVRSFGTFKQPASATDEDVVYSTLSGLVVCMEQQTGRLRWRQKLPEQFWSRSGVLCAEGRIYIPRPPQKCRHLSALFCLDGETGKELWRVDIGRGSFLRAGPVYAEGVVAFGYAAGKVRSEVPTVEAWDAKTGKSLWKHTFKAVGAFLGPAAGCSDGRTFFFSGGGGGKKGAGETLAIEPATGKVLWRTGTAWICETGVPAVRDGKVLLCGTHGTAMAVLSARDGSVIWTKPHPGGRFMHGPSLGPDFYTVNFASKKGAGMWSLADGTTIKPRINLGGEGHGCGPVIITAAGIGLRATAEGLFASDCKTGKILWKSLGFAPRGCSNPIAASGRVFYTPQIQGLMFCFEPEKK